MSATTNLDKHDLSIGGFRPSYLWYLLLLIPLGGFIYFVTAQPIQVLPRISLAPGFALMDENGELLTNEDLRGSLVLYNFTYTHCEEGCAQTGPVMRDLQELAASLDLDGLPIQFVTISFDPERDTPERLRSYAESLGADTENWHFATGEPTRLKNVIGGGFTTYYEEQEDGSFKFTPTFALVDGWGILRARYRTDAPDPAIIERDLTLLVNEIRNSDGASRYAYEAAHLFLCYPSY